MKILITSGIYPPELGGPATFVPQLAKYLSRSGHAVKVVTLGEKYGNHGEEWEIIYVPRHNNRVIRIIRSILTLRKEIMNSDFIFCNGLYVETGVALRICARPSIAKIVGDPVWERYRNNHKGKIDLPSIHEFKLNIFQTLERKFFTYCLSNFTEVICPSGELIAQVQKWGIENPVSYIPNPIELMKAVIGDSGKYYDVITVSRLVSWKNIDKLISVCSKNNWKLAIIGSGPEEERLVKLASVSKSKVEFLGQKPSDQIPKYLKKSKTFALVSDYEGMSFALLQALSCGVPVVVSNNAGNMGVVIDGYNGLTCSLPDMKDLESQLSILLNDKELASKLSTLGRVSVENNFSSDVVFPMFLNKILEVFQNAE